MHSGLKPITVPAELRNPHPLVVELRAAAKSAQEDKGVLALNYSKVLRIRTSRQCLARALILIDTLIKEFESQGYKVRLGERAEPELILSISDITNLDIKLEDHFRGVPAWEKSAKDWWGF